MHTTQTFPGSLQFLQQEALPALFILGKSKVSGTLAYALTRNYKMWSAITTDFHNYRIKEMKAFTELDANGDFVLEETTEGKIAKFKSEEGRAEFEQMIQLKMNEEIQIPFYKVNAAEILAIKEVTTELLFVLDFNFDEPIAAEYGFDFAEVKPLSIVGANESIITSDESKAISDAVNDAAESVLAMDEALPKKSKRK